MSLSTGAQGRGREQQPAWSDYSLPLKIPLPSFYFTAETVVEGKGGGDVQEELPLSSAFRQQRSGP